MRDPVNAALREGLRQGQYPGPLKRISRRQAVAVGGLVGGLMNIPGGVAYGATLGAALPKQKRDTTKVAYLVKRARYQDSGREADVRAAQIGGVLAGSVGAARTGKGTYEAMKMVLREASKVPGSRHLGRAGPFYARALTGGLAGAGAGAAGWAGPGAIVGVAGSKLLRKAKKEGDK